MSSPDENQKKKPNALSSRTSLSKILRSPAQKMKSPTSMKYVLGGISLKNSSKGQNEDWKDNPALQKLVGRYVRTAANSPANRIKKLMKKKQRVVTNQMLRKAYTEGKILKVGTLQKVGGRIKTLKTRFFVLKQTILFYFESKEAYEAKLPPKGWVFLRDMLPKKDNNVCFATSIAWRMKFNAFAVELGHRTFVICTKAQKERKSWMTAIQDAYSAFWHSYNLNPPLSPDLIENPAKREAYETKHPPKFHDVQPEKAADLIALQKDLEAYDTVEREEIKSISRKLVLQQVFIRWKAYREIVKLEQKYKRGEAINA
eukprot:maker-scaffold_2-snap-gene-18.8-mRNA-1 protein AED:0.02 eAED:0.02 QI:82/1/1/1/1/1/4/35/314